MRDETEKKSRSQLKREQTALQAQGERLVGLSDEILDRIDMPPALRQAAKAARAMKSHEARRRQMQYIGALMREADTEPILAALEDIARGDRAGARLFQQAEAWRDALLSGDDAPFEEIFARFPDCDRQQLTRLAGQARRERERGKPPASSRALFRALRDLLEGEARKTS